MSGINKQNAKELGRKGGQAPRAKTTAWNNIVGWLVGDGGHKFKELIAKLSNGEKITKEQKEFLEHFKDLLEFHQPKLSRSEAKVEGEVKMTGLEVRFESLDKK